MPNWDLDVTLEEAEFALEARPPQLGRTVQLLTHYYQERLKHEPEPHRSTPDAGDKKAAALAAQIIARLESM